MISDKRGNRETSIRVRTIAKNAIDYMIDPLGLIDDEVRENFYKHTNALKSVYEHTAQFIAEMAIELHDLEDDDVEQMSFETKEAYLRCKKTVEGIIDKECLKLQLHSQRIQESEDVYAGKSSGIEYLAKWLGVKGFGR